MIKGKIDMASGESTNNSYVKLIKNVAKAMDEVLKSGIRAQIFRYVLRKGFVIFNEIWKELSCSKATVSWHLDVLMKSGVFEEARVMRYRIIYIKGFEDLALERFLTERKKGKEFRWDKVRKVLYALCFENDVKKVARMHGLRVRDVESLKKLLRAFVGNAMSNECVEKLSILESRALTNQC